MEFIITTPAELKAIVIDCLKTANLQFSKPEPPTKQESEKPLSQPEAIEFLGKSRQTLASWRRKGIISAHRLGGRIYYFKSDLLEAMKNNI
jgi:hypothetical protein